MHEGLLRGAQRQGHSSSAVCTVWQRLASNTTHQPVARGSHSCRCRGSGRPAAAHAAASSGRQAGRSLQRCASCHSRSCTARCSGCCSRRRSQGARKQSLAKPSVSSSRCASAAASPSACSAASAASSCCCFLRGVRDWRRRRLDGGGWISGSCSPAAAAARCGRLPFAAGPSGSGCCRLR